MPELVSVSQIGRVGVCTLNQPEKRNPISAAMRGSLVRALENLRANDEIRTVIITGAGNAFCSGLDLDALRENLRLSADQHKADSASIAEFFRFVFAYSKPTIAAINGPAVAGGFGLVLVCDLAIASKTAFLSFSEVKIGFTPAIVALYLARCAGAKICRDLLLTARRISAEEARTLGLINQVVESADLLKGALGLADQICQNSPAGVKTTKEVLVNSIDLPLNESMALAVEANARSRTTAECLEGVSAFLEKRKPSWQT